MGKVFRTYKSEWKRFASWIGFSIGIPEEQWILRNINFEIRAGEAVGIVGLNGAGKSTLLKLIAGTLRLTEGTIKTNGTIAAILELGIGFNLELTGKQNAIHLASLMGHSAERILSVMPEIQAFAEIGKYFNEPMRTYSSGMQMRVAFAVTTAFRPDVLIIDEALSVGDMYFQHKSFGKIREFQEQGTTLLIVSHDRNAIQSLCGRAILLGGGAIIKDGSPEEIFDYYNAAVAEGDVSSIQLRELPDGRIQTSSGTGEAKMVELGLYSRNGELIDIVNVGEKLELRVKVKVHELVDSLVLGFCVKDRHGQVIYGTNTWHMGQIIESPIVGEIFLFTINLPANFGVGSYSLAVSLHSSSTHIGANYDWRDLAAVFDVVNKDKTTFSGSNWLKPVITIVKDD